MKLKIMPTVEIETDKITQRKCTNGGNWMCRFYDPYGNSSWGTCILFGQDLPEYEKRCKKCIKAKVTK